MTRDMREVAVVLVASVGSQLVGYAAMLPLAQMQFGRRGMDMHHLFVDAPFRGQGIGRALSAACQRHATQAGCGYLMVGTHPDNVAAQMAYRAWGFEVAPQSGPRFGMRLG